MNTVILISFDTKFILDKLKEDKCDKSRNYDFVIKRLIDSYNQKELM